MMATSSHKRGRQADSDDDIANHHSPARRRTELVIRPKPRDGEGESDIKLAHEDYTVGWISALPIEMAAAEAMFDVKHESLPRRNNDSNAYTFGRIGSHNIVLACLPANGYGITNAATVAKDMDRSFPSIRIRFMVGIGGGVPTKEDVRLGDIVVSTQIIQYDFGKTMRFGRLHRTSIPRTPPHSIMTAVSQLKARHERSPTMIPSIISECFEKISPMPRYLRHSSFRDLLFDSNYEHVGSSGTCDQCDVSKQVTRNPRENTDPKIHYGTIASSNQLMKHAKTRDKIAKELDALCFEMEAAGLIDNFSCLTVRGISDYADSHKNKKWQEYAAAAAAAYAKELLQVMAPYEVQSKPIIIATSEAGMSYAVLNSRIQLIKLRASRIMSTTSYLQLSYV